MSRCLQRGMLLLAGVLAVFLAGAGGALAATFTASAITAPADQSELFFDADTGSGGITVTGTVSPATATGTGDLLCYSAPGSTPFSVQKSIPLNAGAFNINVSLSPIAGTVCQLRLVPHGTTPSAAAAAAFSGPRVSVSQQQTDSTSGSLWGYNILSGTLPWSFQFGSLGQCPVLSSFSTDTTSLGSYLLFGGNGCLLQSSGLPPNQGTRSAVQVDGLNAYPPGAVSTLAGVGGFSPLQYSASFDSNHDTVAITETDPLSVCESPGGYPPSTSNCPGLSTSGVSDDQTTTLLPGGQVARVSQTLESTDGRAHSVDLLISQSVTAPTSSETPAFEFPGQPQFAAHATPDSFALFPSGPGSIYVIANAAAAPATSNPTGAITYSVPPTAASFTSASSAQTATFLMHYTVTVPAGGQVSLNWSYSQAADGSGLTPLVQIETDRFYTPSITVSSPKAATTTTKNPTITVSGLASDPVGIASLSVNGKGVTVASNGAFSTLLSLRAGANQINLVATNLGGVSTSLSRVVTYKPVPCVVPNVEGKTLAAAKRALLAHDCTVGKVHRAHSTKVKRGRVVSTSPRAHSHRSHDAKVAITVSKGSPPKPHKPPKPHRPAKPPKRAGHTKTLV